MKKLLPVIMVLAASVAGVQAQMVLYEDFGSYSLGTIHDQGEDGVGSGLARWQVQRNSSILGDPGYVTVVEIYGDRVLQIQNRDLDGAIDTIYLNMSMSSVAITGEGTIYIRFKADGPNDTLLCTNDKWPGWDYLGVGSADAGTAAAPEFQGTTNYSEQGAIVRLSGDEDFHARDGSVNNPSATGISGYKDVAMGQRANVWQELWIQVDHANDRTKYYLCEDGDVPTLVANPDGGDWWAMRNEARDNDSVQCLNWKIGMYPFPDANIETNVIIESIAIDTSELTADRYAGWRPMLSTGCPDGYHLYLPGDRDKDLDVDLDDFAVLKCNFGTSSTTFGDPFAPTVSRWEDGDFDGDGDVDLDDFVILKSNFGRSIACPDLDCDGDVDGDDYAIVRDIYGTRVCDPCWP